VVYKVTVKHGSAEHGRHGGGRRRAGVAAEAAAGTTAERSGHYPQLLYAVVLVGVGIGLVIIRQGVHLVPSGTLVLGGVLLIAALARLTLSERRAGLLAVRRRALDVAILGALGIGLLVAGFVVPVPS
jgi:Protein of unknown function (DUF3017)